MSKVIRPCCLFYCCLHLCFPCWSGSSWAEWGSTQMVYAFFFLDVKVGATKKHQPHKRFPALVTASFLMLCSQVSTAQLRMGFVPLWRSTCFPEWPIGFLKNHIAIPTVAAHVLWPPKLHSGQNGTDLCPPHPIPRPVSQQQAWPSDEKVRVLLTPHFSKSTLTLIVLANSLEFPSLPRRQSILWKWKLILTGGLSLGVFSIIYLKKKKDWKFNGCYKKAHFNCKSI